jgi:hypothetical protein
LAQWKIKLGSNSVVMGEQIDKTVKLGLAVKSFISMQVSAEQHTTLAWAGVCLLLPVSLCAGILEIAHLSDFKRSHITKNALSQITAKHKVLMPHSLNMLHIAKECAISKIPAQRDSFGVLKEAGF